MMKVSDEASRQDSVSDEIKGGKEKGPWTAPGLFFFFLFKTKGEDELRSR
jgi:hypothetical protein